MNRVNSYLKNIGKSVKYASIDVLKESAPTIASFAETNSELFKEVNDMVRQRKVLVRKTRTAMERSKVYEAAGAMKTSIFEDLKSGKLYNKDRSLDAFGSMESDESGFDSGDFGDFDMDFGDGDDDLDIGVSAGDKQIASTIAEHSQASADMISNTVARTAEYIVESQKSQNEYNMINNMKTFGQMNSSLSATNDNLSKILDFNNTVAKTHYDNSKTYYQETTNILKENNALMKEFLEMERNRYGKERESSEKKKKGPRTLEDVIDSEGAVDLKEYSKLVKFNMKNASGSGGNMLDMFGGEGNMLLSFAESPLEFIPKMMVSAIVGPKFKKSVKELDKSVSNFFSALVLKFNTMAKDDPNNNQISQIIGKIFGIRSTYKTSIDTSKYNKEAVQWNGKSEKALQSVIPNYLSQIVSLLSGKQAKIFDYDKGKYVKPFDLDKEFENMQKSTASSAFMDFDSAMEKYTKLISFQGDNALKDKENFNKDLNSFKDYFTKQGIMFDYNNREFGDYDIGIDKNNYNIISEIFKNLPKSAQMNFNKAVLNSRQDTTNNMKKLEEQGSIYSQLFEGGDLFDIKEFNKRRADEKKYGKNYVDNTSTSIFNQTDKYNRNALNYLRNIATTLLQGIRVYSMNGAPGAEGFLNNLNNRNMNLDVLKDSNKLRQIQSENEKNNERVSKSEAKRAEKDPFIVSYQDAISDKDSFKKISSRMQLADTRDELKQNQKQSVVEQMLGQDLVGKFDLAKNKIQEFTGNPMKAITSVIDSMDTRLHQIIFGSDKEHLYKGQTVKGFIDILLVDIKGIFSKFNSWLDDKILNPLNEKIKGLGLKDKFSGLFKSLFGIDIGGFKKFLFGEKDENGDVTSKGLFSNIGLELKSAFGSAKDSVKSTYSDFSSKMSGDGFMYSASDFDGSNPYSTSLGGAVAKDFSNMFSSINNIIFGGRSGDKPKFGIDFNFGDTFSGVMDEFMNNHKTFIPKMASSSLIGAGISLIPGVIGGPLIGASIGAATALIKNSETLMSSLFGAEVDGVRGGGLIPKNFMNSFSKYFPDMKKFGITGGLLTMFSGNPLAGIMIGSAVGFAKNNSKFQDFLFGEKGVLGPDAGKTISKYLPKGISGGLLGGALSMFGGPFGLLGSAIIGSGLNMLSITDKFKTAVFGTKDADGEFQNGLMPMLRDSLVKPAAKGLNKTWGTIQDFFKEQIVTPFKSGVAPFVKEFKLMGSNISKIFSDSLDKVFEVSFGKPLHELVRDKIINPFTKFFSKLFSSLGKIVGSVVSAPFKMFGYAGDQLRTKHIKEGNADYMSEKEKDKHMTNRPFDFPIYAIKKFFGKKGKDIDLDDSEDSTSFLDTIANMSNDDKPMNAVELAMASTMSSDSKDINSPMLDNFMNKSKNNNSKDTPALSNFMNTNIPKAGTGGRVGLAIANSLGFQGISPVNYVMNNNNRIPESFVPFGPQRASAKEASDDSEGDTSKSTMDSLRDENEKLKAKQKLELEDKKRLDKQKKSKLEENVALISAEVKGQLDGVGYNVETIKNILEESFGSPENEATGMRTGRGNRKKKSLVGRFTEFIKNPAKAFGGMIKDGFEFVFGGAVKAVKNIFESAKNIILLPFKALGHVAQTVKFAFSTLAEITKTIGPAIGTMLKGAAELITSPIRALSEVIIGAGKGIGEGLGEITKGIGSLIGNMLELTSIIPLFAKGLLNAVGVLGKFTLDITKFIGGAFGTGLKLAANSLFKKQLSIVKEQKIYISGGHLDSIGVIDKIKQTINPTPSLVTEYGVVRYDKDSSGTTQPIKDNVYQLFKKSKDTVREQESSTINLMRNTLETNKSISENTKPLAKLKDYLGKGSAIALGIAALALIAPHIKKIWGFLSGESSDSRKDENGEIIKNYDMSERATKYATKSGIGIFNKVSETAAKTIAKTKAFKQGFESVGNKSVKILGEKMLKEGAEETAEASGNKFVQLIIKWLNKFFTSKNVQKKMGKEAAQKASKEMTEKITKSFTSNVLVRYSAKISYGMGRFTAESSADVASFGISTAIFGVWDFSTGAMEASRLFKVAPHETDWKMKVISSLVKGILGLGNIVPLMDIASEILSELIGFDIKQLAATAMYKAMSNDEKDAKLATKQSDFKNMYQTYKDETKNDISFNAYNDMTNKSVAGSISSIFKSDPNTPKVNNGFLMGYKYPNQGGMIKGAYEPRGIYQKTIDSFNGTNKVLDDNNNLVDKTNFDSEFETPDMYKDIPSTYQGTEAVPKNFIEELLGVSSAFISSMFNGKSFSELASKENITTTGITGVKNAIQGGPQPANSWFLDAVGLNRMSSDYGYRTHPITGRKSFHSGIDYAAPEGTPVRTPVAGYVSVSKYSPGGYGNRIYVIDEKGNAHVFAHLSKRLVQKGDKVNAGQIIGLIGTTGSSTGPHLHYSVFKGKHYSTTKHYDPNEYFSRVYKSEAVKSNIASKVLSDSYRGKYEQSISNNNIVNNNQTSNAGGYDDNFEKILQVVVSLLSKVVNNTSDLSQIISILSNGLNVTLDKEQIKSIGTSTKSKQSFKDNISNNVNTDTAELKEIADVLAQLART